MSAVRLQVLISRAGIASRRAAERAIVEGRVCLNGQAVTTLGTKADPERDVVTFDGKVVGPEQPRVTALLHKPQGVVTTRSDPEGRETVADLVADAPVRLFPIGRLDYNTEGLLLLTTDGDLMNRLLHPKYHVPKIYTVKAQGQVADKALDRLRAGVRLEDGKTTPAVVELLDRSPRATWFEIVVTEGRNRLIRRMCEAVGHEPLRVVRTELATLGLGDLRPGQYRFLSGSELSTLYGVAGMDVPGGSRPMDLRPRGQARRRRPPWPKR